MERPVTEVTLNDGSVAIAYSDTFARMKLGRFKWRAMKNGNGTVYAYVSLGGTILMHRLIMGALKGQVVDHINGNSLDNRDDNLRFCTQAQNVANQRKRRRDNSSGLKGVWWSEGSRCWTATVCKDGKRHYLGLFQSKRRAGLAVDRASLALHGEFAGLNFPEQRDTLRPTLPAAK